METRAGTIAVQANWTEEEIIDRILGGESALYELLIRRYNQKLYRAVRAVLKSDDEAEDVMQEAYIRAYQNLGKFERRSSFATWVTRIGVNEAIARLKSRERADMEPYEEQAAGGDGVTATTRNPESETAGVETRALLEEAILRLPLDYRAVVMMRDVEEMTTAETASTLELTEEAVKVRLHRARAMLRRDLFERAGATSSRCFQFHATRCDRVAAGVLARISGTSPE